MPVFFLPSNRTTKIKPMKLLFSLLIGFLSFPLGLLSQSDPTPLSVELNSYITGLSNTVDIQFQNNIMFIVDQDGIVSMADGSTVLDDAFLNITNIVQFSGERGLLGLAFDPDFETNRTFYVNYVNNSGNTVIASYITYDDSLAADLSTANILLTIDQPFSNHNGGQIQFGPDGYLYIGMGDGGSAGDPDNRSQDGDELLGKMLRIDVTASEYTVPTDNPFVDSTLIQDEIWAFGTRNPWRFSFDKLTGDLWIADVGQNIYEEIDFQPSTSIGGENWGWRCYEGFHPFNTSGCGPAADYDEPIFEYSHTGGHCSVSGGYVYRGTDSELLNGVYLGIDYCSGYLFGLKRDEIEDLQSYDFGNFGFGFTTFGQDSSGEMYVAKGSTIYQIVDPCHSQIPELSYNGDSLLVEEGVNYYWFYNGEEIEDNNQSYFLILTPSFGVYTCVVENEYGCNIESNEIDLTELGLEDVNTPHFKVYPNPFSSTLTIEGDLDHVNVINIYSIDGKLLWSQQYLEQDSKIELNDFQKGSYLLELVDNKGYHYTQLIVKE